MPFTKGELITASKLNEVANGMGMVSSGTFSNDTRTLGPFYFASTGYMTFWQERFVAPPMFAESNSDLTIYKMENGGWRVVATDHLFSKWPDSSQSRTYHVTSYGGAGWYQLTATNSRSGTWGDDAKCEIACFPWQNNCVRGDYLVYYDRYDNSGNPIPGTLLTAEILNTGRVGTRAVL